ncbi:MAG: RHS repeat-associated core domain-containing protein, partial [Kiritimatiellia bacterium]
LFTHTGNDTDHTWTMEQGDGHDKRIEAKRDYTDNGQAVTLRQVHDASANLISSVEHRSATFAWGPAVVTETTANSTSTPQIRTWTYYTDSGVPGYSRPALIQSSEGSWERTTYDSHQNVASVTRNIKDAPINSAAVALTVYDYTQHAGEIAGCQSQTPRKTIEIMQGVTNSLTYHGYFTNTLGEIVEVTERCPSATAAFGDASNLRSETTYYRTDATNTAAAGKTKSSRQSDNTLTSYSYAYGTFTAGTPGAFVAGSGTDRLTFTVQGTMDHPDGIAYRTTAAATIVDRLGATLQTETYVYTGSGYALIDWTAYTNDQFGRVLNAVRANGTLTEATWACCGKESETDESGIEHSYTYDDFKRLAMSVKIGISNAQAHVYTTYAYDAAGRQISQTTFAGGISQTTSNIFDSAGRTLATMDPAGLVTTYQYPDELTTRTIAPGGLLTNTTIRYPDGQTKCTLQNGIIQSWNDYGVNPDAVSGPEPAERGTSWTITYTGPRGSNSPMWQKSTTDLLGHTIRTERPGFGGVILTNASFYNTLGQLIRTTAPGQADTLYVYNELGQQLRSGLDVNGNGTLDLASMDRIQESDSFYQQIGGDWFQVSSSTLYAGDNSATLTTNSIQRTRLTGLGSNEERGTKNQEQISIDLLGNQTISQSFVDRDAKTVTQTTIYPDSTNAAISVSINGLSQYSMSKTAVFTTNTFDALGRQIAVKQGTKNQEPRTGSYTHYNSLGQVDYTTDILSNITSYAYSPTTGQRISVTDALSNITYTAIDPQGRVTNTWGATYPVGYVFDDYGRMVAMQTWRDTNGTPDVTQWLYDQATGLLTNKLYADGKGPSYTYTPDGKLQVRTWSRLTSDLRPLTSTYSYEPTSGSMTNISYSDGTPAVSFTLDRLRRQTTITDGTGTRSFSYNDALQLAAETNPFGTLSRQYDSLGRSSGFTVGTNYQVGYGYSADGRFASVSSLLGAQSNLWQYSFVPGSDLLAGWTEVNNGVTVQRTYEPHRDLLATVSNSVGSTMISTFGYQNDALARRVSRVDQSALSVATNLFGYNPRSELTTAAMGTNAYGFAYDPIGNRLAASNNAEAFAYVANALNQYTNILGRDGSPSRPLYDPDGNLTNYAGWTFTWDAENRLISAAQVGTAVPAVRFSYDYMSRRVAKTVGSTTNQFLYDGWNLVQESAGTSTNAYVWGLDLSGSLQGAGGIGGLLTASLNGTQAFYFFDANGNISDLTDVGGNSLAHYEFDPYGNATVSSGSLATANPFRFSSKYTDDETGLVYYGYRYLSPELGRWISTDPADGDGGGNLYVYCLNVPSYCEDYLGLWTITWYANGWIDAWKGSALAAALAVSTDHKDFTGTRTEASIAAYMAIPASEMEFDEGGGDPDECVWSIYIMRDVTGDEELLSKLSFSEGTANNAADKYGVPSTVYNRKAYQATHPYAAFGGTSIASYITRRQYTAVNGTKWNRATGRPATFIHLADVIEWNMSVTGAKQAMMTPNPTIRGAVYIRSGTATAPGKLTATLGGTRYYKIP